MTICGLKNYWQIEELSADQRIICRLKIDLQIEKQSPDQKNINRRKNYL